MQNCSVSFIEFPTSPGLLKFFQLVELHYAPLHPWLALPLCLFGILSNLVNMAILSRRRLRTATNAVLSCIAVADFFTVLLYFVYLVRYHIMEQECSPAYYSLAWALFNVIQSPTTVFSHTSSVWLACFLALARLRILRSNNASTLIWLGQRRNVLRCCLAIATIIAALCVPAYYIMEIKTLTEDEMMCPHRLNSTSNATSLYYVIQVIVADDTQLECSMVRSYFWIAGVIFKFAPCVVLCVCIAALILELRKFRKRRRTLSLTHCRSVDRQSNTPTLDNNSAKQGLSNRLRPRLLLQRFRGADRATAMLFALVVVTTLTEIPQGIVAISTALYDSDFRDAVFRYIVDLMDLLSLLNSNINFLIYCLMSQTYRSEFLRVFFPCHVESPEDTKSTKVERRKSSKAKLVSAAATCGIIQRNSALVTTAPDRRIGGSRAAFDRAPLAMQESFRSDTPVY